MKTDIDPFAIFAPPILALVVLVLGYVQSRMIRRGRPLSSIQRKLMFYGPVFTLGMCYAIMLQDHLAVLFHWKSA
jgi:TRAP-type mannitol/chloroaromatic compound transport system permease small subunit